MHTGTDFNAIGPKSPKLWNLLLYEIKTTYPLSLFKRNTKS